MKILFCVKTLYAMGGIEHVTIVKANALSQIPGNEVFICYTDKGEFPDNIIHPLHSSVQTYDLGVSFDEINLNDYKKLFITLPTKFYKCYVSLRKLILQKQPDIIISTGGIEKFPLATISLINRTLNRGGGKFIREFHFASTYRRYLCKSYKDRIITRLTEWFEKHLLGNMFDRNFLLTMEDKNSNFSSKKKFEYMHNPMTFNLPDYKDACNHKEHIVIAIGRLTYQKWFDALLQAWAIIGDYAKKNGWRLLILGEGPERNKLEMLKNTLRIEDTVELKGFVSNVSEYLNKASIMCTTSRYEGLQLALIEAMAYGCVPIAFSHPYGPQDVIKDGFNGRIVGLGDIPSFAQALHELMIDSGKRCELGKNAYMRAYDFNQNKIISLWMEKYHNILSE